MYKYQAARLQYRCQSASTTTMTHKSDKSRCSPLPDTDQITVSDSHNVLRIATDGSIVDDNCLQQANAMHSLSFIGSSHANIIS